MRVPVGFGLWHHNVPVEGFIELAPGIGLFPRTEFVMDAALGIRFWIAAPGGAPRFAADEPTDDRRD